MKLKKYLLRDLFDIATTKSVDKNKIEFDVNAPYDFVGRTSVNWGVQGFVDKLNFEPNPKDSFSLVQIGETAALWREKEWYASQNLFILQPKLPKIKDVFLYFQAVINKEMSLYGNAYNSYPTKNSLNKTYISLPVKTTYIPDFDLMASLVGGGIDMSGIDTSSWKEFRLDELFGEPIRGTRLVKERRVIGDIPLVTAGFNNQGIAEFISNEEQITFNSGLTIDMFGNCFYRDYKFKADDNILVFDSGDIPEKAKLFIVTSINKVTHGLYSYGNQYRMKSFSNTIIKLPVRESEGIDWEYMEKYIRAIEKIVIKDVVQYKDQVIKETRKIVGNQ